MASSTSRKAQSPQLIESAKRAALRLVETEFSHDDQERLLYSALDAENGGSRYTALGDYIYRYVRRVYDAFFIYTCEIGDESKQFYREYSIDDAGVVTLGAPLEVRSELKFIDTATGQPVTGALKESARPGGKSKALHETVAGAVVSARETGGSGAVFRIKIIAPGRGSSGTYTREVLERDIARVFPAGTHMYADHPTPTQREEQPERKIGELVAVFVSDPVYEAAAPAGGAHWDGEGPYADVKVFGDYSAFIAERQADIGVSINAFGTFEVNEAGETIITSLTEGESVDFVTKAGAGGKIISLKEAAHNAARLIQENSVSTTNNAGAQNAATSTKTPTTTSTNTGASDNSARIAELEAELATLKNTSTEAPAEASAQAPAEASAQATTTESIQKLVQDAVEAALSGGAGGNPVRGMGDSKPAATGAVAEAAGKNVGADAVLRGLGL